MFIFKVDMKSQLCFQHTSYIQLNSLSSFLLTLTSDNIPKSTLLLMGNFMMNLFLEKSLSYISQLMYCHKLYLYYTHLILPCLLLCKRENFQQAVSSSKEILLLILQLHHKHNFYLLYMYRQSGENQI